MHDRVLVENLKDVEKEALKKSLEELIERTFDLEKEYKLLKKSVKEFQNLITQVVESQPNPMWIVEQNNSNNIFLQNSASKNLSSLIKDIDFQLNEQEIEQNNRIFLVKINPVDGDFKKIIISATDITEQKRSERLASMGQVAAHLAHEIRNPIGSISLLSSTLARHIDDEQKPLVEEIRKAISRVERIIKSTLLFTKGIGVTRKKIPLVKLKEEMQLAFEGYQSTKDIKLYIELNENDIYADFDLMIITLQNFLYNAIDAIEESHDETGEIKILFKTESFYDTIIITDTGVAIKDKNILYEPFQTTKTKGHGLGLALALEIIKAHDGKIELLNETKGFKIYLKRDQKPHL